jgi:hypothetical protein
MGRPALCLGYWAGAPRHGMDRVARL